MDKKHWFMLAGVALAIGLIRVKRSDLSVWDLRGFDKKNSLGLFEPKFKK